MRKAVLELWEDGVMDIEKLKDLRTEYYRYYLHTCGTCDGSGDVDRQQEGED
jgi:Ribonuclease G/E